MADDGTAKPTTILVAYDRAAEFGDAASRDVFDQMDAVEAVLREGGATIRRVGVDLDLGALGSVLETARPDLVFNMLESLGGSDRLQTILPLLLEDWGVPFTGCGSAAMLLSNHKIAAKRRLIERGVPTPGCAWVDRRGKLRFLSDGREGGDWIVKALESHASLHLDDSSVLRSPCPEALGEAIRSASRRHGAPFFAERFIDGREFNLSVLAGGGGSPEVLPPAEIRFDGLAVGRPRIVGYAAKWDEDSVEYRDTPRSFVFSDDDAAMLERLGELAAEVWRIMDLAGYARVDFRVDGAGEPWVLEANSNPCLAPDAGLAAAAARSGISYDRLVRRIVDAAMRG